MAHRLRTKKLRPVLKETQLDFLAAQDPSFACQLANIDRLKSAVGEDISMMHRPVLLLRAWQMPKEACPCKCQEGHFEGIACQSLFVRHLTLLRSQERIRGRTNQRGAKS